jgi:hypothetical protein
MGEKEGFINWEQPMLCRVNVQYIYIYIYIYIYKRVK